MRQRIRRPLPRGRTRRRYYSANEEEEALFEEREVEIRGPPEKEGAPAKRSGD